MNAREALPIILHPTDLTEQCQEALEVACNLARARGRNLVVLHVVPPMVPVAAGTSKRELSKGEHFEEDLEEYQTEMAQKLEQMPLPDLDIPVERRIAQGEVAKEILRVADTHECDMIVMGARTRLEPALPLLGSTAREVLEKAPCPVLIVKMPQ